MLSSIEAHHIQGVRHFSRLYPPMTRAACKMGDLCSRRVSVSSLIIGLKSLYQSSPINSSLFGSGMNKPYSHQDSSVGLLRPWNNLLSMSKGEPPS